MQAQIAARGMRMQAECSLPHSIRRQGPRQKERWRWEPSLLLLHETPRWLQNKARAERAAARTATEEQRRQRERARRAAEVRCVALHHPRNRCCLTICACAALLSCICPFRRPPVARAWQQPHRRAVECSETLQVATHST